MILKAVRERNQVTYKERSIRIIPDFSVETLKVCTFHEIPDVSLDYNTPQNYHSKRMKKNISQ